MFLYFPIQNLGQYIYLHLYTLKFHFFISPNTQCKELFFLKYNISNTKRNLLHSTFLQPNSTQAHSSQHPQHIPIHPYLFLKDAPALRRQVEEQRSHSRRKMAFYLKGKCIKDNLKWSQHH